MVTEQLLLLLAGAMGWSALCDHSISWSYSFTFLCSMCPVLSMTEAISCIMLTRQPSKIRVHTGKF